MSREITSSEHSNSASLNDGTGVVHPESVVQGNQGASGEDERKILRRERNRLAAARCRDRRRERTSSLVQETEELENKNDDIRRDIDVLETQRQKLEQILAIISHNAPRLRG